ncbi:L,D-transpeptidase-like protein [Litoreibacter ponti]|uniref:L,D-transpeptidase-like protein n=1 Tax=Litoreibacter ponti TaxID=1510457 RepID=A0A2T6BP29_9RHOB|nr:L,D-transpeptidase [Litoreibacter ponti]PTX57825.1 L,D-transpeptidase-like protein [Litoreibacter ponti]
MSDTSRFGLSRRRFLLSAAATGLAAPALAQNTTLPLGDDEPEFARRNISSFRALDWQPYFSNLNKGAILVDIDSRALHMWTEDGQYNLYPSSVPLSEDLTRRGRTSVIRKVDGPTWSPTPAMKKRNPEWPDFVPAGPDNPLGTHALYLTWTYYRIHGTHDTRKIGRRSSNGCIGLFNEHIAEVFGRTQIGTQVLLI